MIRAVFKFFHREHDKNNEATSCTMNENHALGMCGAFHILYDKQKLRHSWSQARVRKKEDWAMS